MKYSRIHVWNVVDIQSIPLHACVAKASELRMRRTWRCQFRNLYVNMKSDVGFPKGCWWHHVIHGRYATFCWAPQAAAGDVASMLETEGIFELWIFCPQISRHKTLFSPEIYVVYDFICVLYTCHIEQLKVYSSRLTHYEVLSPLAGFPSWSWQNPLRVGKPRIRQ